MSTRTRVFPDGVTAAQVHLHSNLQAVGRPATATTGRWSQRASSLFQVRTVGYAASKQKAPSGPGIMTVAGVDLVRSDTKVYDIAARMTLPLPPLLQARVDAHGHDAPLPADIVAELEELAAPFTVPAAAFDAAEWQQQARVALVEAGVNDADTVPDAPAPAHEPIDGSAPAEQAYPASAVDLSVSFPPYLVLCLQGPCYDPSMWGSTFDGESAQLVYTLCLAGAQRRAVAADAARGGRAFGPLSLLQHLACSDLVSVRDSWPGRMKGIPRVANLDELDLGWVLGGTLKSYNGTPFLTGPVHQRWRRGSNYLAVDVDIHEYTYVARKAANAAMPLFPRMRLDIAWIMEAREDALLPETCLAAVRMEPGSEMLEAPHIDDVYPPKKE